MRRWDRPFWLADYLAGRDIDCPGCGYNLRGLTQSSCPECGYVVEEMTLRVIESRPSGMVRAAHIGGFTLNLVMGVGMLITWGVLGDEGALAPIYVGTVVIWVVLIGAWGFTESDRCFGLIAWVAWLALAASVALGVVGVAT